MPDLKLVKMKAAKQCSICRVVKNHSEYCRHRQHDDGLDSRCKDCKNTARRTHEYRVKSNVTQREWRNRPENIEKTKASAKKFRESEYGQKYIKNDALVRNYGVTLEQYNAMFAKQKGLCAVCKKHQSEFTKSLSIDHDHITGDIRELLCHHCNTALGAFKESPQLLSKAIQYLEKHNSRRSP